MKRTSPKLSTISPINPKLIILGIVIALTSLATFLYVQNGIKRSKAAADTIDFNFTPKSDTFNIQGGETFLFIQPQDSTQKISSFDVTINSKGALGIIDIENPTFPDKPEGTVQATQITKEAVPGKYHLVYVFQNQDQDLPSIVQIHIKFKGLSQGEGGLYISTPQVTGTTNKPSFDIGNMGYGSYNFTDLGPTPTPEPPTPTIFCKTGVNSFAPEVDCGNNSFRYMTYGCYDGTVGREGSETSCKSLDLWKSYAEQRCQGKSSCSDITPTPTCIPRPACLDAEYPQERCMMPETTDMCPKASPTPTRQCAIDCMEGSVPYCPISTGCPTRCDMICVNPSISPSPTPELKSCPTPPVCENGNLMHGDPPPGGRCAYYFCVPNTTPPPSCLLKPKGDADCNGTIDLIDFEIWRKEFAGEKVMEQADFNNTKTADLADFEIWRKGFFGEI